MNSFITCGIDIGTTTLSAVVLDITNGKQIEAFTREHRAALISDKSFERIQDADRILSLAIQLLDSILDKYPEISSIGFTGQMHGILYTDKEGRACSPLYTWQDGRGNEMMGAVSYAEYITSVSGRAAASGYGLVTHYYNSVNSLVPDTAVSICSIMDYLVMSLSGRNKPICHPSVAASFGLYDIDKKDFDRSAVLKLGIDIGILPGIMTEDKPMGKYRGIDICPALGDNQASVFGSVADEDASVLVHYGTGSQVSVITDGVEADPPLEVRPYIGEKNLICGCALCGGYAYEVLEGFFASYARALGNNGNQYAVMDSLAECAYYNKNKGKLKVAPLFKGTRENPEIRGSVSGLSVDNFDAGNLILATVEGMADELYYMYSASDVSDRTILVASGNGVRKNKVLQSLLRDRFGMKLSLLENKEEAAMGAAMYSALCMGYGLSEIKKCILYSDIE